MKERWPLVLASAGSGLIWGAIVTFLLLSAQQPVTLAAGFLFSPLVGIVAGTVAGGFKDADMPSLAFVSLLSLYLTATLFGFGTALLLRVFDPRHLESMLSTTLLFPWAMTMGGYVAWMWPLSYLNHRLIARLA